MTETINTKIRIAGKELLLGILRTFMRNKASMVSRKAGIAVPK